MTLIRSSFRRILILRSRFHTSCASLSARRIVREFKLADIGEGITECEVIRWSVKPANVVQAFDPLCEVQSDKATVEITSPFDGTVKELLVKEGEVAKVGSGLCTIEVEEEVMRGSEAKSNSSTTTLPSDNSNIAPGMLGSVQEAAPKLKGQLHPLDPRLPSNHAMQQGVREQDILAPPSVRHHARRLGIDLVQLAPGSGKSGRIEKRDIEAFLSKSAAQSREDSHSRLQNMLSQSEDDTLVELGRTRYSMWKAMTKSLEIPQFGFSTRLDITSLHRLLPVLNHYIPTKYLPHPHQGSQSQSSVVSPASFLTPPDLPAIPEYARFSRLTFLPFLMKTLSKAMEEWPLFRSSITLPSQSASSADKPCLAVRSHADISIALSTPTGLYTPTIQRVDSRSIFDITSEIKHLSHLGRQVPCGLTPKEMPKRGGTVTISNVGGIGDVDYASPILVPGGGVAIVAIGRAKWIWDVNDGNGQGERRLQIGISWTADHRVIEGAELIAFVEVWRSWIEKPERLITI